MTGVGRCECSQYGSFGAGGIAWYRVVHVDRRQKKYKHCRVYNRKNAGTWGYKAVSNEANFDIKRCVNKASDTKLETLIEREARSRLIFYVLGRIEKFFSKPTS